MSSDQGGAGRREVAWRVFAAEFDDSTVDYSESDEERAPNYVITPTGARVNRLFVVGVLTEVEAVSDDVLRARIVDPTGAFVVYAGQYQPEAMAFLESATPPQFVAVTGKARTFQPEDSDRVFTSIRPESINRVDADTRDRWTVQTAEHTLERVSTFADALEFGEGVDVEQALLDSGVDAGLAAGIPLAMQHYGTTKAYLADVWSLSLDSIRVVAGEIDADEVGPLTTDLDEPGEVDVAFDRSLVEAADVDVEPDVSPDVSEPETEAEADAAEAAAEKSAGEVEEAAAEAVEDAEQTPDEVEEVEDAGDAAEDQPTDEDASPEVSQEQETVTDEEFEPEPDEDEELGTGDAADEMYEMDEEERQEVEEEFGTEFTSGAEIGAPGEADIETPSPDEDEADLQEMSETLEEAPEQTESADSDETGEAEAVDQTETATSEDTTTEDVDEEAAEAAEERPDDLEETVMDTMRELDEGDGVGREELMAAVVHDYDVTPDEVEDALQDALMSGQCYESGEDTFSPI